MIAKYVEGGHLGRLRAVIICDMSFINVDYKKV